MSYRERSQEIEGLEILAETKKMYVITDDIDPYANHLHHTGPLKIFETERARIFEEHGMPVEEMAQSQGVFGFVREIEVKYLAQLMEGDTVEVASLVFQTRPTILSFQQIMTKEGRIMVEAIVDAALANRSGRPVRIPQEVIDNLKRKTS